MCDDSLEMAVDLGAIVAVCDDSLEMAVEQGTIVAVGDDRRALGPSQSGVVASGGTPGVSVRGAHDGTAPRYATSLFPSRLRG